MALLRSDMSTRALAAMLDSLLRDSLAFTTPVAHKMVLKSHALFLRSLEWMTLDSLVPWMSSIALMDNLALLLTDALKMSVDSLVVMPIVRAMGLGSPAVLAHSLVLVMMDSSMALMGNPLRDDLAVMLVARKRVLNSPVLLVNGLVVLVLDSSVLSANGFALVDMLALTLTAALKMSRDSFMERPMLLAMVSDGPVVFMNGLVLTMLMGNAALLTNSLALTSRPPPRAAMT